MDPYEPERREFVRVKVEVPVRYMFLCKTIRDPEMERIYEGTTSNIGAGGILLVGQIPKLEYIPEMLLQHIVLGLNIFLPQLQEPIKALARVSWVETIDEQTRKGGMGLRFRDIPLADRDKIFRFVIAAQMKN
jgi:c-di-GMP-binding flagellar brake protein YcgR